MQRIYRQVSKRQTAAALVTAGLPPTSAQQAIQAQAVRAAATQAQNPGSDGFSETTAWTALATAVLSSVGLYAYTQQRSSALCEEQRASSGQTVKTKGSARQITADEVAQHDSPDRRVWVTHKGGVYDITEFVEQHPGGAARIMLAAGGSVDSFWAMYQQHQTEQVQQLLEGYRIGDLEGGQPEQQVADPYSNEPTRHKALVVRSDKPFNAEVPLEILNAQITPNEFFYVRNHLPVPNVDASKWSLRVEGEGLRRMNLSLADLHTKFKKHTVTATLQCSGNRRAELSSVKQVKGLFWDNGAIGTAVFGGVLLRDVLQQAGLDEDETEAQHIQFEGLDAEPGGQCYGASIPLDKAVQRSGDVLLAYEMNGRALPVDHGFPLRVVVPGVTGARSVKWLTRIIASRDESGSHWQQRDYKSFSPMVDWDNVDWASAPAIQETPVQSAILSPSPNEVLEGPLDEVQVSGWAFSGGGHGIIRVDVSADQGNTWTSADLKPAAGKHGQLHRQWAWTHWEATVPLSSSFSGKLDLCCRAVDASYNTQPENMESVWNLRGVINNAWHHVNVEAK